MTYHDQAPLSPEQLRQSTLEIRSSGDSAGVIRIPSEAEVRQQSLWRNGTFWRPDQPSERPLLEAERQYLESLTEQYLQQHEWAEYRATGLHRFQLDTPPRGGSLQLTATYSGADGVTVSATLPLQPYHSTSRSTLSVETSNRRTDIGQYAVFHVRSNFPMSYFYLLVSSAGWQTDADCALLGMLTAAGRMWYASRCHFFFGSVISVNLCMLRPRPPCLRSSYCLWKTFHK